MFKDKIGKIVLDVFYQTLEIIIFEKKSIPLTKTILLQLCKTQEQKIDEQKYFQDFKYEYLCGELHPFITIVKIMLLS